MRSGWEGLLDGIASPAESPGTQPELGVSVGEPARVVIE